MVCAINFPIVSTTRDFIFYKKIIILFKLYFMSYTKERCNKCNCWVVQYPALNNARRTLERDNQITSTS